MPPLFRRNHSPDTQAQALPPEAVEALPLDPLEFIMSREDDILKSTSEWAGIGQTVKSFRSNYRDGIQCALVDIIENSAFTDDQPSETAIALDADKIAHGLSVYSAFVARETSIFPTTFSIVNTKIRETKEKMLTIPDSTVSYVIASKHFPTREFLVRQSWLEGKMCSADDLRRSVLYDLTVFYSTQPGDVQTLADLYTEAASEADTRYKELQDMISTDWHHPDPNQSILKNFCAEIYEQPEHTIHDFANAVAEAEGRTPLSTIRDMAAFAVLAMNGEPTPGAISAIVRKTADKWADLPAVQGAYDSHVKSYAASIEKAFASIAGSRRTNSIRTFPTFAEVEDLKNSFNFDYSHLDDRATRRTKARMAKKKPFPQLTEQNDIEDVAASGERISLKPKPLAVLRKVLDDGSSRSIVRPDQIDPSDVLDEFDYKHGSILGKDIQNIVEWLRLNPMSGASRRLRGVTTLVVNGRDKMPLWRLRPDHCKSLKIHPESRSHRVVYGLLEGSIVLVDILPHDRFDQRYSKKLA